MDKLTIFIPFCEIGNSSLPPTLYIVTALIAKGAPIKINRANKFDVSELSKEEIIFIKGSMTVWTDWKRNGLCYEFEM